VSGRVLLVDDDAITRRGLLRLLTDQGYAVQDADDGITALSLIDAYGFDAVLTDFHLGGGIDGLDILNHFNKFFPEKRKILMSGTASNVRSRCVAVGASYFSKPLAIEELLKALISQTNLDLLQALMLSSRKLLDEMERNRRMLRQLRGRALNIQSRFREVALRLKV
jgi:CheY-like chemotaxis protein